jgi:hypothetical protein
LLALLIATPAICQAQAEPTPVKLCVAMVKNTSNYSVDTRLAQSRLIRDFNSAKKDKKGKLASVEAIPLQGQARDEVGPEAQDKGCGYVLYSNIVMMQAPGDPRQPNPPGTVSVGRSPLSVYPGGPDSHEPVFEVQVDFQLNKLDGGGEPLLASSARTNEHNDENGTVAATFDIIVSRVRASLGKQ